MSIKQAISGPTPPQSYAALVKAVLRYRQKRVYILAFAGVVLTMPASTLPVAGLGEQRNGKDSSDDFQTD